MLYVRKARSSIAAQFGGLGSIFRSTAILSGLQLLAKGIGFASLPILSRIYTPEEFGVYSAYLSAIGILAVVGIIRMEFTIPMAATVRMARYIMAFSLITALFSMAVVMISGAIAVHVFDVDLPAYLLILIFTGGLFMIWFNVLDTYFIRLRIFQLTGVAQVLRYFTQVITQFGMGNAGIVNYGLMTGDLLGRIVAVLVLLPQSLGRIKRRSFLHFRIMFGIVYPYLGHCLTHTTTTVLHVFPTLILPLFILGVYSKTEAGYFSFAYQVVLASAQVVMLSLAKVFVGEISDVIRKDPGSVRRRTRNIVILLSLSNIIPAVIIFMYADEIYVLAFGDTWRQAGAYFRILLPAIVSQIVIGPVFNLIILLRQAHRQLRCDAAMFVAVCVLMGAAASGVIDIEGLLVGFSAAITIGYVWLLIELFASISVFEADISKRNKRGS